MSLDSFKFLVTTSYAAVSLLTYFIVDYVLLTNRKVLDGSFFRLFLYQSFFNFLTYFNSLITLRLPQNTCQNCTLAPIFQYNEIPGLNYFHTVHYHMAFVQYFFTAVISGNRFSMMLFPFSYEKFWKWATLPIIGTIALLPFIATWPFLVNQSKYDYNRENDWYALNTTVDRVVLYNYLIAHMITITTISSFFNVATIFLLIVKSRDHRAKKSEQFLIIHSFIGFVIELFTASVTVLNRLAVDLADSWYMKIGQIMLPFVSDALTLLQPFILIVCSSSLRSCLLFLITRQNNRVSAIPTISVGRSPMTTGRLVLSNY